VFGLRAAGSEDELGRLSHGQIAFGGFSLQEPPDLLVHRLVLESVVHRSHVLLSDLVSVTGLDGT